MAAGVALAASGDAHLDARRVEFGIAGAADRARSAVSDSAQSAGQETSAGTNAAPGGRTGRRGLVRNPSGSAALLLSRGRYRHGRQRRVGIKELLRIKQGDNNSCVWQGERSGGFKRGDWNCTVYSRFRLTSTPDAFFIEETVRALEDDKVIFERHNKAAVKRDLM